ncbi:MAG: T9SS type A sorting domain-containing protein [Bacteroidales bacterium]|nr:T9SS type A sorting domain-containing protein [Bacteroidales bacterium]
MKKNLSLIIYIAVIAAFTSMSDCQAGTFSTDKEKTGNQSVKVLQGVTNPSGQISFISVEKVTTDYRSHLDVVVDEFGLSEDGKFQQEGSKLDELDFGDAPDQPYPTLLVNNGARHLLNQNVFLGNLIDSEADGQPTTKADGDDTNNLDDEDGITFKPLVVGQVANIKVKASVAGYLNAWVDFNNNGSWADAGDQIFSDQLMTAGVNNLTFNIPAGINPGETYTRFRFNTTGGLTYTGLAEDGEVEDYKVVINPPGWGYIPTGSTHLIAVPVNVAFNCITLSAGDFIGVFYTDDQGNPACGGAVLWDAVNNQAVVAYGNDQTTPVKDGFSDDEYFMWKVFYSSTGTQEILVVNYNQLLPDTDGKYHTNGISGLTAISKSITLTVSAAPNPICSGLTVQLTANASGGCGTLSYIWTSDPVGFSSNISNPTDNPTTTTTYFVTVQDSYSSVTDSVKVTVLPLPQVSCPQNFSLCINDPAYTLTGGSPGGGTYTGTGVSAGKFYPATAGVGTHVITYTYTDTQTGCTNSCTFKITVNALPQVSCPQNFSLCINDPAYTLTGGSPGGGTYAGTGVSAGKFYPATAGVGTHVITYTYTDTQTGCTNSCTFQITVNALPQVSCPQNFSLCINDPAYTLTGGSPGGGTYTGTGVSAGKFYPATAGVGTHVITYTFTDTPTGCTNSCTFQITVNDEQVINIPGGWSGVSSYITPPNTAMSSVIAPIGANLVIISNFIGSFWPGGGVYTLNNWDNYSGYWIKVNQNSSLPICGVEVSNKTVNLAQNWNIIPVLSTSPVSIFNLFSGVSGFQIAKDVAGTGVYWPAYSINTIGNVVPGKAYYVRMSTAGSIDYSSSPKSDQNYETIDLNSLETPWNPIISTPASHVVLFNLTESPFRPGDIIGGFTSEGLCAGLSLIENSATPFVIALNGDDPISDEVTGFVHGEPISFKIYRPDSGEVLLLEAEYNPEMNAGLYESNGLSEVNHIKTSSLSVVNMLYKSLKVYPNPGNGLFTLEGDEEVVNIMVLNVYGEAIMTRQLNVPGNLDLSSHPSGVYLLKVFTSGGFFFEKLIIR